MQPPLRKVSAACVTFNRLDSVRKTVRDFQLQDYKGEKELVILNTCGNQFLKCDHPDIVCVNHFPRPKTLGECRNVCIEHCSGDLILNWDDDDTYAPSHISRAVSDLGVRREHVRINGFFDSDGVFGKTGPVHQLMFTKELFNRVGKYPKKNTGEDRVLVAAMRHNSTPSVAWRNQNTATLTYNTVAASPHVSWTCDYDNHSRLPVTERGVIDLTPPKRDVDRIAAIAVLFNPANYLKLVTNYQVFAEAWEESGIPLHTVEVLLPGQTKSITGPNVMHLNAKVPFFHKESAINYAVKQLPTEVDSVCWVDADFVWDNYLWVGALRRSLALNPVVQMWRLLHDLDEDGSTSRTFSALELSQNKGSPGGAWAADRRLFTDYGGLFDRCIVGGGDSCAAAGFREPFHKQHTRSGDSWNSRILEIMGRRLPESVLVDYEVWRKKVSEWVGGRVGLLHEDANHLFHGRRDRRNYGDRYLLVKDVSSDDHLTRGDGGLFEWKYPHPEVDESLMEFFKGRVS